MISDERVEKAMHMLADTDIEAAEAKALVKSLEVYGKTVKAFAFLEATGTVAEREAKALNSDRYEEWRTDYDEAVIKSETLANRRQTAAGEREVWRSLQANRRQGA